MSDNKLREEIERLTKERNHWKEKYEIAIRFREKDSEIIELLRDKVTLSEEKFEREKQSHNTTIDNLGKMIDKVTELENEITSISEDTRPF